MLILSILILSAYPSIAAYGPSVGYFLPAVTSAGGGTIVITQAKIGSVLGQNSGGIYEIITMFFNATPDLRITKNVIVLAPSDYVSKGGGVNDAVPGATLVFTLTYFNYSVITGNTVEIVDIIPTSTEYATAIGGNSRQFSNNNGATWTYSPASPVDAAVTNVKWLMGDIPPSGNGTVTLNVVIK